MTAFLHCVCIPREEVKLDELIKLAKRKKVALLFDLGSGAITDLSKLNLPVEKEVKYYINMSNFSFDVA